VPLYKAFHEACFIWNPRQMPSMQKYRVQTYSVSDLLRATESVLLCARMKKLTALAELESQFSTQSNCRDWA
jgi:hypothetical protein